MREPPITKPPATAAARAPMRAATPVRVLKPRPAAAPGEPRAATGLPYFPHAGEIGRRLGSSFSAAAMLDPEGCARAGVPAFTAAGRSHFATANPSLRVAAHEAAHVLQQSGRTRDMGLGAEGHAASVERVVASGGDARALIGPSGAPTGPGPHAYQARPQAGQAVQNWNAGMDLRVSDDGSMAVQPGARGTKNFWATAAGVTASNAILAGVHSPIRLGLTANTLVGPAPVGGAMRTVAKVAPTNLIDRSSGDAMTLPSDCGVAARSIMGAGSTAASYSNVSGPGRAGAPRETSSAVSNDPVPMANELLGGASGGASRASYDAMTPAARDAFDRAAGINRYAHVPTGGAYAIATGPTERPGDWNFHWGGVVMSSGGDQVTLENYAGQSTTQWGFAMYGTALGQSFHEEHFATDTHGTQPITMGVHRTAPP